MDLPDLPGPILKALMDIPLSEDDWLHGGWWVWEARYAERPEYCQPWVEHREAILSAWIADRPGTRPSIWWRLDAPEERPPGESEAAFLKRHRLLLRGEGRRLPAEEIRRRVVAEVRPPHAGHQQRGVRAAVRELGEKRTWHGRSSQPADPTQDLGKERSRHGDLGQLEDEVAPVAHDPGADLDQLLAQAARLKRDIM